MRHQRKQQKYLEDHTRGVALDPKIDIDIVASRLFSSRVCQGQDFDGTAIDNRVDA